MRDNWVSCPPEPLEHLLAGPAISLDVAGPHEERGVCHPRDVIRRSQLDQFACMRDSLVPLAQQVRRLWRASLRGPAQFG